MITKYQDEQEVELLTKPMIDLVLIRSTRGDEGFGLQGTLCRGEFLEAILRLVKSKYDKEPDLAPYLEDFLKTYI